MTSFRLLRLTLAGNFLLFSVSISWVHGKGSCNLTEYRTKESIPMAEPARPQLRIVSPDEIREAPLSPGEILHRIQVMKARCAWNEIVRAFHPLDEKVPDLPDTPEKTLIMKETAFALSQTKRFNEAIQILLRCHELEPQSYQVASSIAFNYYNALMCDKGREIRLGQDKGRYLEESERWFTLAEELYPSNVVDYYRHGMLYHSILDKKDKMACTFFEKAIANWENLSPQDQERRHKDHKNYIKALYHLAKARMRLGKYAEAEEAIRQCIENDMDTDYEEPLHKFYLLGRILLEAGREEEALAHLKNAAHMRSQKPKDYVYYTLASCLVRLERWDEALQWLERIPSRFLKPHMKRLAGWIHYRLGHSDKAGALLDQALAEDKKGRHLTLVLMGRIFMDLENWEQALRCFKEANEFKRREYLADHEEALLGQGFSLMRMGQRESAEEIFRKILAYNEWNREAALALKELTGIEWEPASVRVNEFPF